MNCIFKQIGKNLVKCNRCGLEIITTDPPERCYADCEKAQSDCKYLNTQNKPRLKTCESCSGNVQIKIFQCRLYKECTIYKQIDNIQVCHNCKDYISN